MSKHEVVPSERRWSPRATLESVRAYDVDPTPCALELADNTSQFGAPPAALRAIAEGVNDRVARYPTTYSRPLREAIGRYIGVSPDEIMVGCGSDELLGCTFRALATPGDRVAYMDPTFVMTRVFAQTNSLQPVGVPLTSAFQVDAQSLLDERASVTYVCTPNNPTGTAMSREALGSIIAGAAGLVMVDEAYAEFAGTNLAAEAPAHDHVLVYRTFSKAFALAGARVGFVVGKRPLIAELEKVRGPYTVTALSERAALAAVTHDIDWVGRCVAQVREARELFSEGVRALGLSPLPSAANFVLVPVVDAASWGRALREEDILVRHFVGLPVVGDALRITVGDWPMMQQVLAAMTRILARGQVVTHA